MQAGSLTSSYSLTRDYSVVIDQQGIIKYKKSGINVSEIKNIINGLLTPTGIQDNTVDKNDFVLEQNYPNPFNLETMIYYFVPELSKVTIKVYNLLGQEIETLVNDRKASGFYSVIWNGENFTSGIYFYRIEAIPVSNPDKNFIQVKKMILIK
jgi:hypothetical protein